MRIGEIRAIKLGKQYLLRSYRPTLAESIKELGRHRKIWAAKNINLSIQPGEQVGIIGDNGSGKTSLLRMISGITIPTSGLVQSAGRIAPILQVSAGFRPELTGRENVFLNGMLLGMKTEEIRSKLDSIIEFFGMSEFFDSPIFTYSSGMVLRLAFSVAIHSDPDILLIDDETIFVGDRGFQKKIRRQIKQFKEQGKTILIVSHILVFLRFTVDRIIYMHQGRVKMDGPTVKVLEAYKLHQR